MKYAIVSGAEIDWPSDGRVSLTDSLGCAETQVELFRPGENGSVAASTEREGVCVPLEASGRIVANKRVTVPSKGVACVPAGMGASLRGGGTWLMVSATTDASPGELTVVDSTDVRFAPPSTSTIDIARLTTRLGCTSMKVNLRRLEPGEAVPYHTEGSQEELFVPLDGPGKILINEERYTMTAGSVSRVAPKTPRSVVNDGEEQRTWFMVGAPPTGDADNWDPGAEILDWPDSSPVPDDSE
ncbi:MAG: cupin domain-containing protein [Haloarculaceae archaeon]